uniref:Uncharacterized protein n=1 Tax=Leersia perrieri TaxID=77586 RepID=A0A0D9WY86_9ORYZ
MVAMGSSTRTRQGHDTLRAKGLIEGATMESIIVEADPDRLARYNVTHKGEDRDAERWGRTVMGWWQGAFSGTRSIRILPEEAASGS